MGSVFFLHLLRVDRPGDVFEAPFKMRLHHGHHAREGAELAPAELDGRQRQSVRRRAPTLLLTAKSNARRFT